MASAPGGAKRGGLCYDGDAMRCPNCAGEVPAGSRFCGICGRNITAAPAPAVVQAIGEGGAGQWPAMAAQAEAAQPAMSLFELPASRRARLAKMALVLVLDAVLAGAGVLMILSYLEARRAAPVPVKKPAAGAATGAVEVGAPKPVAEAEAASEAQPARAEKRQEKAEEKKKQPEAGDRGPGTGNGKPVAAPVVTPVAEAAAGGPAEGGEEEGDGEAVSARLTELVQQHEGELEGCYQRVAKGPGPGDPLEGRIEVHVTVLPDGSVRDVHAGENTTGSAPLATCVVSLFQSWTLPAGAAAPVELVWPLQFRAPAK